jgi:MinD superfamily P-loop ATPase
MRKKRLRRVENLSDVISIKTSKENHQVHLSQKLKYTPVKCEDCDRMCPHRRVVNSKVSFSVEPNQWLHQCSVCHQYYNPKTGKFNTSWIGVTAQYSLKNYRKR